MAEPLRPTAALTHGRENWYLVTTVAGSAPTTAEMTATSTLDITHIAFASTGQPSQSTNRVTAERRLGDTTVAERIGDTSYQGGDMLYAFSPQAAAASPGKKLYELIPAGTQAFLVRRLNIARATAPAAGQFVDVFPVEFGPSMPTKSGDGEAAEAAATCSFAVTDTPTFNVAIAA
ncbi:hypothetical protein [Nocardioides kribbensis]|uniref:Phage tail protein n=1 Tax=Nocardioides kribbensis TaxID=305517 RepID=A0ABV1NZ02_9ACTN